MCAGLNRNWLVYDRPVNQIKVLAVVTLKSSDSLQNIGNDQMVDNLLSSYNISVGDMVA